MEDDTNFVKTNYVSLHTTLLEISGMWSARKFKVTYLNYTASFCLFIIVLCPTIILITELAYLIQSFSHPLEVVAYIGVTSFRVEGLGKLAHMLINRNKLKHLLETMHACFKLSVLNQDGELVARNDNVNSIMEIWSRGSKILALSWVGICSLGGLQWALIPFGINGEVTTIVEDDDAQLLLRNWTTNFTESRPRSETHFIRALPLRGWFPFNATSSPAYELLFLIQAIAIISPSFSVPVFDQFYCAMLLLLCGQFECLKMTFKNISTKETCRIEEDKTVDGNCNHFNVINSDKAGNAAHGSLNDNNRAGNYNNRTDDALKTCIRHHQSIISAVRELNSIYSPLMFLQCLKSLLALCLVAFQGSMVDGDLLQLFSLMQYLFLLIVQIFLFCWCASEVTEKGLSVQHAAFGCDWPDASKSFNSSLRIVIVNCQTPLRLSGGVFCTLSMELFLELLRLSFSYYTVLRQVHENNAVD